MKTPGESPRYDPSAGGAVSSMMIGVFEGRLGLTHAGRGCARTPDIIQRGEALRREVDLNVDELEVVDIGPGGAGKDLEGVVTRAQ